MVRVRAFEQGDLSILANPQPSQLEDAARVSRSKALSEIQRGPAWTIEADGDPVVIGGFKLAPYNTAIVWALVRDGVPRMAKSVALRHCLDMIGMARVMGIEKLVGFCTAHDESGRDFLARLRFTKDPALAVLPDGVKAEMWVRDCNAIYS